MNDLTSKEAAETLDISPCEMNRRCINGEYPGAKKISGQWYIPRMADPRFAIKDVPENLLNSDELSGVPENKKQDALKKLGLIKKFRAFTSPLKGEQRRDAEYQFAATHKISRTGIYRWLAKYRNQGLLGLVDIRGNGKFLSQIISEEAFDLFKSMYLTQQQLSVKTCRQNICYINKSEKRGWKIPSLPFMYKYVKNEIPLSVQVLLREGIDSYKEKCAPYIQIEPDSIQPGEIWVGDHSQFNCWIRHRERWIRPWLTAWQDMRSRAIVGFYISASPNQTTILQAMKRAIIKYGPPESVKIDNGKDYDSECWTGTTKVKRKALAKGYIDEQFVVGIYAMMNVGISFAIPYNPQSKGTIERFFKTINCQFTKTIPTYCGEDTERKPDDLNDFLKSEKAIREAYDINTFVELAGEYIEVYNNSVHTGAGMDDKTPAQVFATRQSRRILSEGVLDLIMRIWSGEVIAGKNGVQFKKIFYGQYNTELMMHQGKKVRISYDPDDLRQIYVYDSTTLKFITIAEQNQLIAYGSTISEENLREAMSQKAKALKIAKNYRDSRLTANMDLTTLTIRAMQDAAKDRRQITDDGQQTLKPVRTPLDDQVREHERQQVIKHVRRASGAESLTTVLDMDFSLLERKDKYEGVRMLDDDG